MNLRGLDNNVLLAGVVLAVAAALALATSALPARGDAAASTGETPHTARWLCPLLPGEQGTFTITNTGQAPAQLRATVSSARQEEGEDPVPQSRQLPVGEPVAAGAVRQLPVEAELPSLLEIESFGAPVAISAAGQPTCSTTTADQWWLSMADTSGGDTEVVLANPGRDGAVVQIVIHVRGQAFEPSQLRRLFIPGGAARRVALRELISGFDLAAAQVRSLIGEIAVGAVNTESGGANPLVVPAQAGSRNQWRFAGGLGGRGDQTEVLLTNPNDAEIAVEARVLTDKGPATTERFADVTLPPGSTRRVALDDVGIEEGLGAMGVEVRTVGQEPFAAALLVRPASNKRLPVYVDPGGGDGTGRRWILPHVAQPHHVSMANFGTTPVNVTLLPVGGGAALHTMTIPPSQVQVWEAPPQEGGVIVEAATPGLVVMPLGRGPAVPGVVMDGVDAGGPVLPGPVAN